jgi:hypothetical protein
MYRDQNVRAWMGWIGMILLVGLGGCGRAVGTGNQDAGENSTDGSTIADAAVDPDADDRVHNVLGWHSNAEEHSGFVAAQDVDNDLLDACSPWLMAADGGETWWTFGTSAEALLPLYPNPDHWEGVGLGLLSGHLSDLGEYGHMGMYDRELWVTGWELQTCATVERARHCVAPRADDFCQLPETFHETRRNHLVRILPGPIGTSEIYELTVYYDEGVGDGETRFQISLELPQIIDPDNTGWVPIPVGDLLALEINEERLWFAYQLIPFPNALDGWVLRSTNTETEVLRISLSAENANDEPLHIWGDFPVNETIGYP